MNSHSSTAINILIAEDDPSDIHLIKDAFQECKSSWRLHVVQDGEEAMDFLLKQKNYKQAPSPSLVILDLNMPKKTGKEVLGEMKLNENLKQIPVLIFSTSQSESDIFDCYALQACTYITKPMGRDEYIAKIREIEHYWTKTSCLPLVG